MATFQEKLAQAKAAGYSEDEIHQYIQQKTAQAKAAGYSDAEITAYLGTNEAPAAPKPKSGLEDGLAVAKQLMARGGMGMSPQGMLETAQNLFNKGGQVGGEAVATKLAQNGVNPTVAAAAGMVPAMAPDIITAMSPAELANAQELPHAVKSAAGAPVRAVKGLVNTLRGPSVDEAKTMGQAAIDAFKPSAANKASELGQKGILSAEDKINALKEEVNQLKSIVASKVGPAEQKAVELGQQRIAPLQEKASTLQQKLSAVPLEQQTKLEQLNALKQQAGQDIGKAEQSAGVSFKSTPRYEKFIRNRNLVSQLAQKLETTSADDAASMSASRLQRLRKLSEGAMKEGQISDLGTTSLAKGNKVVSQALEAKVPGLGEARTRFKTTIEAINALPEEGLARKVGLRKALQSTKADLGQQQAEIKDMLSKVRNTEQQALSQAQKATIADKQKQLLQAMQDLKANQREAQRLTALGKNADVEQLQQLKAQHQQLLQKAYKRDKILKALKWGAVGTVVGSGGAGKVMRGISGE